MTLELCYKSSQTLCFQGMIKLVLLNCVRFCISKDSVTRRRSDKKPNLHLKWMETWMKRKKKSGESLSFLCFRVRVRIRSRTPVRSGVSRFTGPLFFVPKVAGSFPNQPLHALPHVFCRWRSNKPNSEKWTDLQEKIRYNERGTARYVWVYRAVL